MTCEEEFNALRRAERDLAAWRRLHSGPGDVPEAEVRQRSAELSAALRERQDAYNRCRGAKTAHDAFEALMRDASGAPLGGGAGPPM
ncbi:hypothetical protein ABIA35_004519 [Catenulispora sp. MAP12-49]|jgi:hypothetical protein|uniref:hypothetical protein n=1 Tax=unclassified Catenulispora TaxID=414885 RepID=UPI003515889A